MAITVNAIKCPICEDIIYSCARHDFHSCTCGNCDVDGGFDYLKYGWKTDIPEQLDIEVDATKQELYDSWNNAPLKGPRKFGKIKSGLHSEDIGMEKEEVIKHLANFLKIYNIKVNYDYTDWNDFSKSIIEFLEKNNMMKG